MLRRLFLLLLLLAVPLFAEEQQGVHVIPFGPVDGDWVTTVHIPMTCGVTGHNFLREGSTYRILLLNPTCVNTLPIPYIYSVTIPDVSAGSYRVEVMLQGSSAIYGSTDFIVRDKQTAAFEMHPSVIPTSVAGLRVRLTGFTPPVPDFWVEVNGVRATNVTRENGVIWFEPPPLPAGVYNVDVRTANTHTPGHHLYYYDGPDVSLFERVLFPVLFSAAGANGSQWISEAVVSNPKPWYVETVNTLGPIRQCFVYPCDERLDPQSVARYGQGFPQGAVLHVPRNESPTLSFALRVRDTSQQAQGFGTQVPVVREQDFVHGEPVSLLNVPLDARYRVKLRMYALDPVLGINGQITALSTANNAMKFVRYFELQHVGDDQHWYAELDLPAGEANERVNLYFDFPLDSTAWAFATVTNNATQQVTTVTPNGSGEQPCTGCTVP